ncbi:MAG: tetratricopeptide repeat protein [Phycisphaerales bacterium]|nr:tetratricopeptide repeat protein [Phycisphaerales bacterium]
MTGILEFETHMAGDSSDWISAEARVERARGLFQSGKLEEAATELRRALASEPDRGDWHHNLAVTFDAQGRHGEALATYERALELIPGHVHALLGAAQGSIRAGKLEQCVRYCERAAKGDPKIEPAYSLRITALGLLQRYEDAESVYFLAQQYLKELPLCLAEMANVLAQQASFERAIWCYREALAQSPKLIGVKTRLGVVLRRAGQLESAHQVLVQAMREQPGDANTILALGRVLEDLDRVAEAEEKYRRIVELEPANPSAHIRLGDMALRAGRLDEARAAYTLVIALGVSDMSVRLRLVEALTRLGATVEAGRLLEELFGRVNITTRAPITEDASIALGAAGAALECAKPKIAARILIATARRHPKDARLWLRLARAQFECGDRAGARRAARRSLAFDRGCVETLHNIALDALTHGELRRARAAVNRGLRLHPAEPGLRRIRLRIVGVRLQRSLRSAWRALPQIIARMRDRIRTRRS